MKDFLHYSKYKDIFLLIFKSVFQLIKVNTKYKVRKIEEKKNKRAADYCTYYTMLLAIWKWEQPV